MSAQAWRVYTHAANPNGPGWLVASTLWTDSGPQPDSYEVLMTLDTQAEAQKMAADTQREYDNIRNLYAGTP